MAVAAPGRSGMASAVPGPRRVARARLPCSGKTPVARPPPATAALARAFDDTVACLATATAKTTVCQLLRIAWRPVIVSRVAAEAVAARDPLAVVDHDSRRLVWAAPGRDRAGDLRS